MAKYRNYGFNNESSAHTFLYLQQHLLNFLHKDQNQCILDLGCGNRYFESQLIRSGYNAYGTNASERGIAIAKRQNPLHFHLQDLFTGKLLIVLQQLKFDTTISTEVIQHLYDPEQFIRFCKELLSPHGGELIITIPYGYLLYKWDLYMSPLWIDGHIKLWSKKTLNGLLRQHGIKIKSFKGWPLSLFLEINDYNSYS